MELKLMELHDEDRFFLIRTCMPIELVTNPTKGSVVKQCEECGRDVWFNPNQVPPTVHGIVFEREVVLCFRCVGLHQEYANGPAQWVGPGTKDGVVDAVEMLFAANAVKEQEREDGQS